MNKLREKINQVLQENTGKPLADVSKLILAELDLDKFLSETDSLRAELENVKTDNKQLQDHLENERMRLAACGVTALCNTEESIKHRIDADNPYYSASYSDVCRMVDREMSLCAELENVKAKRDEAYNEGYTAAIAFIANSYQTLGDLNTAAKVRSMHTPETSILCQEREKLVVWADTAVQRAEQAEKELDEEQRRNSEIWTGLSGMLIGMYDEKETFKMVVERFVLAERQRCAEIAINNQGTRSMFFTARECEIYNEACKTIAAAIMEEPK